MAGVDRKAIARQLYEAFSAGDREFFEQHLADDLAFHSPPDPQLDRDGFFERCWPGAGRGQGIDVVRTIESGDEVVVTYVLTRQDGTGGRNTEVLTFDGDKVTEIEVYFGWDRQGTD
jgi:ketosteroid isomerase-like protein